MEAVRALVDVLTPGRVELDNSFLRIPKDVFNDTHLVPGGNAGAMAAITLLVSTDADVFPARNAARVGHTEEIEVVVEDDKFPIAHTIRAAVMALADAEWIEMLEGGFHLRLF